MHQARLCTTSKNLWYFLFVASQTCFWLNEVYTCIYELTFNPFRLKANMIVRNIMIRDMLFADNTTIASQLQSSMNRFANACTDCKHHYQLQKCKILSTNTNIIKHHYQQTPIISGWQVGSSKIRNRSLDTEIDRRIGSASTTFALLATHVLKNPRLTIKTRVSVLYGSVSWTTYADKERKLNIFGMLEWLNFKLFYIAF